MCVCVSCSCYVSYKEMTWTLNGFYGWMVVALIVCGVAWQLRDLFVHVDPVIVRLKERVMSVFPELAPLVVNEDRASYTWNKHRIYLCVRDREGNVYADDILMNVLLHEIAHTLCDEVGHTDKFHAIFQGLLDRAAAAGIYNHTAVPRDYCQQSGHHAMRRGVHAM